MTTARLASVDWQGVRRMRNRLIHGYDSIDVARVWDAVEIDITPLISEITSALAHWPQS